MSLEPTEEYASHLQRLMGVDPAVLQWPQEFTVAVGSTAVAAVFDPHNAMVIFHGATAADFSGTELGVLLADGERSSAFYSRLLVFAAEGFAEDWQAQGFRSEGNIAGYWADGGAADLWAWGERRAPQSVEATVPDSEFGSAPTLPGDWVCRPVNTDDAEKIGTLLRQVFTDYPIPTDPGSLRYALASGVIHGRVVCDERGDFIAYAAVEFQSGGGAVEITDCATLPKARKRGVMTNLVSRLQDDVADVFDGRNCYCLAREDQPAMQRVLARLGWQRRGCLVGHFRVGDGWVSGNLWVAE